jgi:hypothetical protein
MSEATLSQDDAFEELFASLNEDTQTKTLDDYQAEYEQQWTASRKAAGQATESVLKLGRVVFEAEKMLSDKDFATFRQNRPELKGDSMVSQMITVGENTPRFSSRADALPASWYSLYLLTRMSDEQIDKHIADKTLHPLTTQREVLALVKGPAADDNDTPELRYTLTVHLVSEDVPDVAAILAWQKSIERSSKTACEKQGWRHEVKRSKTILNLQKQTQEAETN